MEPMSEDTSGTDSNGVVPTVPVPPPPDNITKAVHNNAKHRMTARRPVVIQKCEICNIELIGQVVIDAHMKGSKHAKKLKAQELLSNLIDAGQVNVPNDKTALFRCDLCNVILNSTQQLEIHNAGARHKGKVHRYGGDQSDVNEADTGNDSSSAAVNDNSESEAAAQVDHAVSAADRSKIMIANPLDLVCNVCNITVNSPQQLEQHLNSKKHLDREAGRKPQRPGPYVRASRGTRGGLGSQGRGGKGVSGKFTSLSNSFKSAGYSNSFIKPEGGVIMPPNCGTSKGPTQLGPAQQHANKAPNFGGQFKNRGNFGSLSPYISTDGNVGGRGGYNARGGAPRGGWGGAGGGYGAPPPPPPPAGYSGYDYGYAFNYSGYENNDGYEAYGMLQPGPPPTY